jgi:branched-chain amino acid aminotransferase
VNHHVDGEVVPAAEATVPVDDRGFRYGDRAVEPVRVHGGRPLAWDAHADRLRTSLDRLSLPAPGDLRERVADLVAAGATEALLSVSVTRGTGAGLTPADDPEPRVVIRATARGRAGVAGSPPWDGPARLQTVKTRRVPDRSVPADARTGSRVDAVLARAELHAADEALVLDAGGRVVGGADAALLFVADDAVHTPSLDGPVEPRVARSLALALARAEGLPVREGSYVPDDVRDADEALLATADGLRSVAAVDGIDLPGGPVAPLLAGLYDRHVEATCHDGDVADPLAVD